MEFEVPRISVRMVLRVTAAEAFVAAVFAWGSVLDLGVEAVRQVVTAGPGAVLTAPAPAGDGGRA